MTPTTSNAAASGGDRATRSMKLIRVMFMVRRVLPKPLKTLRSVREPIIESR